jgi:Protein of unknown function (DUF3467)
LADKTRQVPVEGDSVEDQAKQQTGKQVRLRVDHTGMGTTYANAFKTNATSEEVIVDLGLNMVVPNPQGADAEIAGDILFQVNNRLILNYYTAKRLALSLGQLVRGYEEKFGELKLNVADRAGGDK